MVEKVKDSLLKLADLKEQKGIQMLGNLLLVLTVIIMGMVICIVAYFFIADFLHNH
ncbi:hypothetical protein [Oceanobacillus manasiensis]|uniref:hypothetical protein n=1 Tax=Oceanobacillus manasiensis TaxID=586413 RepID=UPI000B332D2F|nr:hypothetical protein [Oceanobacillus manasiensis]